tara:strand:+ start:328 stop:570 length:243 start_codon:yes stop_codon:yes gene_type:complete
MENNPIQEVTFDGDTYSIENLTPRVIESFNTLFKGQQKLNDLAIEVRLAQAGISALTENLRTILKEDKIKPTVKVEEEKE